LQNALVYLRRQNLQIWDKDFSFFSDQKNNILKYKDIYAIIFLPELIFSRSVSGTKFCTPEQVL